MSAMAREGIAHLPVGPFSRSDESAAPGTVRDLFGTSGDVEHTVPVIVAQALLQTTDSLREDFDLVTTVTHLINACRQVVGNDAEVSIVLADDRGDLYVSGSSSDQKCVLDQYQIDQMSGPTIEAYLSGEVSTLDLLDIDDSSWPRFSQLARAFGYVTLRSVPLGSREACVGVLSIAESVSRSHPPMEDVLLRVLARGMSIGFTNRRAYSASNELSRQLQHALTSRIVIEQSKGVVAARLGISVDDAFEIVRTYSRRANRKLTEVSQAILEGTLGIDKLPIASRQHRHSESLVKSRVSELASPVPSQ